MCCFLLFSLLDSHILTMSEQCLRHEDKLEIKKKKLENQGELGVHK